MNVIKEKLINIIKKSSYGISLDRYIQICLFDKYGYYNNREPIGKKGDFITAPEISQLFGEIIGLYIYDLWQKNRRYSGSLMGHNFQCFYIVLLLCQSHLQEDLQSAEVVHYQTIS